MTDMVRSVSQLDTETSLFGTLPRVTSRSILIRARDSHRVALLVAATAVTTSIAAAVVVFGEEASNVRMT